MIKNFRAASAAFAVLMAFSFFACSSRGKPPESVASSDMSINTAPSGELQDKKLSAWAAYWNLDNAADELDAFKEGELEAVCHFAAMFDQDGNLYIENRTKEFFESVRHKQSAATHYLTIVNDVRLKDGASLQKDTEILEPKLKNLKNRKEHIDEIIHLAAEGGYGGVEIDYETLHRKKGNLLDNFALFCGELYEEAQLAGLKLRIVLEPSFPADKAGLPPGPDYVVMIYNLFGYGTAPGPKADAGFIREVSLRMKSLPGPVVYAFATGGFDWSEDGSITAVTEKKAQRLLPEADAGRRDPESGCRYFTYTSEDGQNHEVWFADGETLSYWMDIARQSSTVNRFSIWRLGENNLYSVRKW